MSQVNVSQHPTKTLCYLRPGNINYKVVPMSSLLDPAHCKQSDEWSVGFPGAVCDHTVNFNRLSFNNPTPSSLKAKDVILTNSHGINIHSLSAFKVRLKQHVVCLCVDLL